MASGGSTAASHVLQRHNAELVTAISAGDILSLTLKLYGEGLIERDTKDDVCLLVYTPLQKACIVVSAVERKVEADPSLFHQFTALLQDEGDSLKAISKRLMEKYRSIPEKELGPSTLPPYHTPHEPSPLQPHSPLSLYANKLRNFYAQSELPKYSNPACYKWTPSPSKKYIDLSTIDRKGMTTKQVDECKKAALYGQINKITEKGSTNTVKLEEILQAKPGEKLECVLVEGPPGIGKSTLAWQVCHCWGKRELFQQYSTVLLLPLRDQRVQGASCVEDLFISADTKLQARVRKEVSQENWDGQDTLIILEGLDELPSHLLSQPSIFTALLSGEVLSQAAILVTSRPSATEQLHKHWKQRISRHFEIKGFTEENVDRYAQSVLFDHEQIAGFRKYASFHPRIQSMLYVPLHCVIAVTVYLKCQQSRTPPPETLTGLYTCLTKTILTQYLDDHPQYTGGGYTHDTVIDLCIPRPVHNYFKELCRIAFEHVSDKQLIFSDLPKELHDLGFTDAVPELFLYQQSANYSYNFLHLSVQEYLTAYHISLMSPSEQEQLLKTKGPLFWNVFRFVAGITKFKGLNKAVVRQAIGIRKNSSKLSGSLDNYSLEVLYECQDMSILDTEYTYSVKLYDSSLHRCLVLGYCIANSSCGWKLELQSCSNGTLVEIIHQGLRMSKACHTSYSIRSIQCYNCSTDFTHMLFTQHTTETFMTSSLDIEKSDFTFQSMQAFASMLQRNQSPTEVNIKHCSIDSDGVCCLAEALHNNTSLRKLKIQNPVGGRGTLAIAEMLKHNTTLEELNIAHAKISIDGTVAVAAALHHNTTLKKLDMSWNPVGERGGLAMAEMLKHNTTLEELNLSDAKNISGDTACCLAEALHHNTKLKKLNMSWNPVGERGALAMAEMLKHNTTLEELDLGEDFHGLKISAKGIKALVESLAVNQHLKKLTVSDLCEDIVKPLRVYRDNKERVVMFAY